MATMDSPDSAVVFRSSKKRNTLRNRGSLLRLPEHADEGTLPASIDSPLADTRAVDDEAGTVTEVLRMLNPRKARLHGVEFRVSDALTPSPRAATAAEGDGSAETSVHRAIPQRFTRQTGRITELNDKHMTEYIESNLARRQRPDDETGPLSSAAIVRREPRGQSPAHLSASESESDTGSSESDDLEEDILWPQAPSGSARDLGVAPGKTPDNQPAALRGKLQEVDLGAEARERNVFMTERARHRMRRRINGDDSFADADDDKPDRIRIGRDGLPRPSRTRQRRGSHDVERDKIVEELLHQNKPTVDVYSMEGFKGGAGTGTGTGGTQDEFDEGKYAADDRIAEQFRREFLEALNQRRRLRRRKASGPSRGGATTRPGRKLDGEILRGPKLGGSRNDRAHMRDLLLQKEKDKGPQARVRLPRR